MSLPPKVIARTTLEGLFCAGFAAASEQSRESMIREKRRLATIVLADVAGYPRVEHCRHA